MSTIASALCFAVWTIFSIVGLRLEDELSETELGRVASCGTF
jgi:nitrate/nitrite transporter NarK